MAQCIQFVCSHCEHSIESWDEGNPFYIDITGKKVYAYHPSHERDKCTANDVPHLCLKCGTESKIDSRLENKVCPECGSKRVAYTYKLEGVKCPKCKKGKFKKNDKFYMIS